MMKKLLMLTMMTTILSLNGASNLALKPSFGAQDNNLRNKTLKFSKKEKGDLVSYFLESINNFKPLSAGNEDISLLLTPSQTAKYDKDNFYKMFPCYNEGGEYISVNEYGNPIATKPRDISLRYYDGDGLVNCEFSENYDIDTFDYGKIHDCKPVSILPPAGVYFKNNNEISPCVTSASISIIKSISTSNDLKGIDTLTDKTTPYILNSKVGKKSSVAGEFDLNDPFYYDFSEKNKDFLDKHFSTTKYNGVTLLEEKSSDGSFITKTDYSLYAYTYNEYAKLGSVIGWGGDSIISGMAKYLESNTLSENGKHRYTMEGTRKLVNSSMDSYYELCKYIVNNKSGVIGGDDDFKYPNNNNGDGTGGHAFVIVGYGVTQKRSALDNLVYDIPEIIYCSGWGQYAAIPAMDLCDWFDLTIKQQNKEWFGWRTSTNSTKWYK